MLILESLEHARARDAHIYGEVLGYGSTNDAFHVAASPETGEGAARDSRRNTGSPRNSAATLSRKARREGAANFGRGGL